MPHSLANGFAVAMVEQQFPLGLLNIETKFAGSRLAARDGLAQIHECEWIPIAVTSTSFSNERFFVSLARLVRLLAQPSRANTGCCPTWRNQYFAFEKSPSRRCMIACQKLPEVVSMSLADRVRFVEAIV